MNTLHELYWGYRMFRTVFLGDRRPFACSLAPTLACNLACSFCYTASPRAMVQTNRELSVENFKKLCLNLYKRGIRHATLTDGEPLLNDSSFQKCKIATEIFDQTWMVTNGTRGFPKFRNTLYIVSIDGDEEVHDRIRGKGTYKEIEKNVSMYRPAFFCNTTLTNANHNKIESIIVAAKELGAKGITFAWSTPMTNKDILHVGNEYREADIDKILRLKGKYGDFILNSESELNLMRNNKWSKRCPNWFIESYDAYGNKKPVCVFGKPTADMCENCGCNIYPSVLTMIEQKKSSIITKLSFNTNQSNSEALIQLKNRI